MKKISLIIFSFVLSFAFSMHLYAIEGYTIDSGINVRSEANVNSTVIDTIVHIHTTLDVVENKLYNVGDSNCSSGWYKINYKGSVRYICGLYVSIGKTPGTGGSGEVIINTEEYEARIGAVSVYVRKEPSYNADGVVLLPGTNITVLKEGIKEIGTSKCPGTFDYIRYYDNKNGYVCSTYVNKKENIIASDSEYEAFLKTKGFPDTYIPYLVYLHKKHPTWTFNAINTNLYWENVINGEENKQLIQTNVASYVKNFNAIEGNDWFHSTNAVNAFYLDPRNFLTERFIFMFENLGYIYDKEETTSTETNNSEGEEATLNLTKSGANKDSAQTIKYYNAIASLFGNSHLGTEEYIYDYIDAGFKYKVSPTHLASRSVIEGMLDANYSAVSGKETRTYDGHSLKGYYNLFNIGSFNDNYTNGSPVLRGLAYACGPACTFNNTHGRPWDSIEKAIYGGAEYIASGYIAAGQNTLYFEKFNTSPTSDVDPYTNQYQTNVLAPCQEGEKNYESYVDNNLLEEEYIFDIPIYLNMPDIVSLPSVASTINTLSAIKIDGKVISGFDKDILTYSIKVNNTLNTINVSATKDDVKSKVSGEGVITLSEEVTTFSLEVTSESGVKRTYTITVTKVEDATSVDDILANLSFKNDSEVLFNIKPNMTVADMEATIKNQNENASISVKTSDNKGVESKEKLRTGYIIQIVTISGDTKEFTISIMGDTSGDGVITILDLLKVQKHILNSSKLSGAYLKAADTNGDGIVTILDLLRIQKVIKNELAF